MRKKLLFSILGVGLCVVSCKKENNGLLDSPKTVPSIDTVSADTLKVPVQDVIEPVAYDGIGYMFKAVPGSDVSTSLQAALDKYKVVYIDEGYVISNSLDIQSGGSLLGVQNAALKAANTRSGFLNTRGTYIDIRKKSQVRVAGIKFRPADNMVNMASYGNAVILISNSSNCIVEKNNFDFEFEYGKGMDAVWVTTGSNSNVISDNYVKTLGITYCENGSSYNRVENNRLINSSSNALGGIGNGTQVCFDNIVLNNYIENAGRMGIEDQQKTSGTIIKGNVISGTGKTPGLGAGLGMGISTVATNSTVENNKVVDAKSYYIEVRGNSNMRVLNNEVQDEGTERGIFVNFVGKSASSTSDLNTLIQGNTVVGCLKAIETFGDGTSQLITITKNRIVNPSFQGINIDLRGLIESTISIKENQIIFNRKSNTSRHGIVTYTTVASGSQNASILLEQNEITYDPSSVGGLGYDIGLIIQVDKAIISHNTINGYAGGLNYGITNNGSKTIGVKFLGNIVKNAIWNTALFPA